MKYIQIVILLPFIFLGFVWEWAKAGFQLGQLIAGEMASL